MSTEGPGVDDAIRTMLLFMPRIVGRVKKIRIPDELQSFSLAPRHLSLLAYLLFEGQMGVNELAARLEVAPATVSLMVSELSRKGILERHEDEADRRRTLVSIADAHRPAIDSWLGKGATAWRKAFEPLSAGERQMFIDTLAAYDREIAQE
ncbi:MarR family winged helix-turn-helix transcriptional regulator [Amycolatopsis sp.]|uniref:MarR family winged helix-turn-helix transcriptional regulator n=1 Tax=Amycolatopsis sp. TaxID=37632 RepID=UPI002DF904FD|nr:MarR family winged helix-turn-helix transcriptional regulator [Amycolatopsis sp.]